MTPRDDSKNWNNWKDGVWEQDIINKWESGILNETFKGINDFEDKKICMLFFYLIRAAALYTNILFYFKKVHMV